MTRDPDPKTRLFRACEPNKALSPDDLRYVNCDDVRGENLAELFEQCLRMAEPTEPLVKLFAGHRGVGKTSELLRLKAMLERPASPENPHKPFKVLFFDVSETLDVNDLDFPDLLVLAASEVQRQLNEARIPGFSATATWLKRVWDELEGTFGGDVQIKEVEAGVGFGKLAFEIRNRPNARTKLREKIERQGTNLLGAVNDLLTEANANLRKAGYGGLVLIIDGLDKLVRRPLEGGSNTHERLFIHRSSQLASLQAHTVYTVPISLYYSPLCEQLEEAIGEFNLPLSMICLRGKRRSKPTPDTPGMKKMWEMVEKRCQYAKMDVKDVFDSPDTGYYLCQMTGGHPRHLMMFIQAAAAAVDTLPITRDAADKAIRRYANSLLREVPDEFWPKLHRFDKPRADIPQGDIHQQMLLLLHVFEYMNGEPWYEVNPVLRTLPKFKPGRSRSRG